MQKILINCRTASAFDLPPEEKNSNNDDQDDTNVDATEKKTKTIGYFGLVSVKVDEVKGTSVEADLHYNVML